MYLHEVPISRNNQLMCSKQPKTSPSAGRSGQYLNGPISSQSRSKYHSPCAHLTDLLLIDQGVSSKKEMKGSTQYIAPPFHLLFPESSRKTSGLAFADNLRNPRLTRLGLFLDRQLHGTTYNNCHSQTRHLYPVRIGVVQKAYKRSRYQCRTPVRPSISRDVLGYTTVSYTVICLVWIWIWI